MATSQKTDKNKEAADPAEIKRKLAWRMGAAGLMIVGLLGALALFDRLSTPGEPEASAPQFTEPVPVAKKVITQPVTPAEPAPEAATSVTPAESSAPPVDKAAPRAEPPPRPEVAAHPTLPRASQPAGRSAASQSRAIGTAAPATIAPSRSEPPAVAAPPAPPRLFSGYALQAGVFSDPSRAEALHARLILEGIPSTIEARVQVGPFKSRAEAEEVREKMKAMGIDSVMLLPKGVKR